MSLAVRTPESNPVGGANVPGVQPLQGPSCGIGTSITGFEFSSSSMPFGALMMMFDVCVAVSGLGFRSGERFWTRTRPSMLASSRTVTELSTPCDVSNFGMVSESVQFVVERGTWSETCV